MPFTPDYAARQARLRALLPAHDVRAVALVPGANMLYHIGLHAHLSERPLMVFVAVDGVVALVPELEAPKLAARADLGARLVVWADADGPDAAFAAAADALGLAGARLGVDDHTMRVFEWLALADAAPSLRPIPLGDALLGLRAVKTDDEVAAMRRAIALAEDALAATLAWVQPGTTERAIAARLEAELFARHPDGLAFDTAVQSGPNSALPHGTPSDRVLAPGEPLLIDFGVRVDGYPSDITRTVCFGAPTPELAAMHQAVLRANEAARLAVRPGVTAGDVDAAARAEIAAAGYAEAFIHRTGHGLGLDIHELPQVAAGVDDVLQPGMVFTIEPGVYVAGVGGVRIEDNVLVTPDGCETLTSTSRRLVWGDFGP